MLRKSLIAAALAMAAISMPALAQGPDNRVTVLTTPADTPTILTGANASIVSAGLSQTIAATEDMILWTNPSAAILGTAVFYGTAMVDQEEVLNIELISSMMKCVMRPGDRFIVNKPVAEFRYEIEIVKGSNAGCTGIYFNRAENEASRSNG